VILAATACSSSSSGGSGGTLQVWVRGAGDAQKAYQKLLDSFTAKTGIKTKLFMTLTDFETKVNAAATAHKLPDVVVDDAAQTGAFQSEGIIREVDRNSIAGGNQIADATWNVAKSVSGKYYAVPFSVQANLLFIRQDWLQQLHLQPPKTWDDLATVAKAFTTKDPNHNGKADTYGMDIPGSTSRGYISWYWSTFLWQAGASTRRRSTRRRRWTPRRTSRSSSAVTRPSSPVRSTTSPPTRTRCSSPGRPGCTSPVRTRTPRPMPRR
jgi:multiple sugar transport system substrate-binding protein